MTKRDAQLIALALERLRAEPGLEKLTTRDLLDWAVRGGVVIVILPDHRKRTFTAEELENPRPVAEPKPETTTLKTPAPDKAEAKGSKSDKA